MYPPTRKLSCPDLVIAILQLGQTPVRGAGEGVTLGSTDPRSCLGANIMPQLPHASGGGSPSGVPHLGQAAMTLATNAGRTKGVSSKLADLVFVRRAS